MTLKGKIIIYIIIPIIAFIPRYYAIVSPMINNSTMNSPSTVNNGVTSHSKSTAIMIFKDITNDGKIMIPIDFETPHKEDYYQGAISVLGSVPYNGVINVKLFKTNFQQYNKSLFSFSDPYLIQDIRPRPVSAGKLNENFSYGIIINYVTNLEYHNRNDSMWYEVPIGNVTFQFNYSNEQNSSQSFTFTQPFSIKVKGIPPVHQ